MRPFNRRGLGRPALKIGRAIEGVGDGKEGQYACVAWTDAGESVRRVGWDNEGVISPNRVRLISEPRLQSSLKDDDELIVQVCVEGRAGSDSNLTEGEATAGGAVARPGNVPLAVVGPPRRLRYRAVVHDWH